MATVDPTYTRPTALAATVVSWAGIVTADTVTSWEVQGQSGETAALSLTGTWNGGTTALFQISNDGTVWFTADDWEGTAISSTANGFWRLPITARYCRINVAAGSADSITATLVLRG